MRNWFKKKKEKLKKFWSQCRESLKNSSYFIHDQKCKIRSNIAIIESRSGEDFASNMFYMARELEKRKIKIYIPYKKKAKDKIEQIIEVGGFSNCHMVRMYSYKYYKLLAISKYLFNDVCFDWKYIKRSGQIYINTWHGTPLKTIGFDVQKERFVMGNIQRNLVMADYLISPSNYYTKKMLNAFHIDKLFPGKILHSGYPRNSVFFDKDLRKRIKNDFGLSERQTIVYMPTWRGAHANSRIDNVIQQHLAEIDALLLDSQVLYVKLHNMDRQNIRLEDFVHIQEFPTNIECYQFLAAADCLITDYSSVFFDFANSGQKIVLFAYDEGEYLAERGTYFDMKKLPFPTVRTVEELVAEINTSKGYEDQAFRQKYCTYDRMSSAADIAAHIFDERTSEKQEIEPNGKKNILIYCGGITLKNGIITALKNLLSGLDMKQYNYFFSFTRQGLTNAPPLLEELPAGIQLFPISSPLQKSLLETWSYYNYYNKRKDKKIYKRYWNRLMKREMQKHFPQPFFDIIIDFEGYGTHQMLPIIQNYPGKRVVFVHNNMDKENKLKNSYHPYILRDVYRMFDAVALVSTDLYQSTLKISGREDNLVVIENSHNYQGIRQRAMEPIILDKDTEVRTWNTTGIEGLLQKRGYKFITIGRFSPEKGHLRLMEAFDDFCERYSDAQLIIIGGYGNLYGSTLKYVHRMKYWRNVTIIKSIKNPMPILKRCDLFLLPSLYEGLGLVILEADCLGVPSFATNVEGPSAFMQRYKGHLVESSIQGILQGMYDFVDGKVHTLDIDYSEYNKNANKQFIMLIESLLEGDKTI